MTTSSSSNVTPIDGIEIHPWIQVSSTEWIGSAFDHRYRVGSQLKVRLMRSRRGDSFVWHAQPDHAERLPGIKSGDVDDTLPLRNGAFSAGTDIQKALREAQEEAEDAVLTRYDMGLYLSGWKRPE